MEILSDERLVDDEFLFSALDYTVAGLEEAGALYKAGQFEEAKKSIVNYFRTRQNVKHFFDYRGLPIRPVSEDEIPFSFQASQGLSAPIRDFALYAGRKLMNNIYVLPSGHRGEVDLGPNLENEIHFNIYTDTGKRHRGTMSVFSRAQFLEYLAFLYHETQDQKVLDKFQQMFDFFIEKYPLIVEDPSIDCGHVQLTEDRDVMNLGWLGFVYTGMLYFQSTYELGYKTVFEIIKHLYFVMLQLRRYDNDKYRPYNHHFFERGIAPYCFAILYPEFPEIRCMKERGARVSLRHIKEDFSINGGYNEQSLAYWYGAAVSEMLYRVVYVAKLNNEKLLDDEGFQAVDNTFTLFATLVTNGDFLPSVGDNRGPYIDPILQLGSILTNNIACKELYEYRKGIGPYPEHLDKYYVNNDTGFVIGRSGVDNKSNAFYMLAKVNSGNCGHNHMDMLSMDVKLRGQWFVSEPYSGFLYSQYRMNSIQRGYCYNMTSHNSVLCHGEPICSWEKYSNRFGTYRPDAPITEVKKYDDGLYVSAYHYGYTFCAHSRSVLFSDNGKMIVHDVVEDGHRLPSPHIQRWNLEPGVNVELVGNKAAILTKGDIKYLWVFDRAQEVKAYRQTELLSEYFSDDNIGYTLDVYFVPNNGMGVDGGMNVPLSTLMIDITEKSYDIDELQEKCARLGSSLSDEATFEELRSL